MNLQMFFLEKIESEKVYNSLGILCFGLYFGIGILICGISYINNLDFNLKKSVRIRNNIRKIGKEFLIWIPIFIVEYVISKLIPVTSQNQLTLVENFKETPIISLILAIIFAPICEEALYRYIPFLFIKNKKIYIIISSIIFAGLHVMGSSYPVLCLIRYLPFSLWLGYRFAKTEDIDVSISLHMLHNIIAAIPILISIK